MLCVVLLIVCVGGSCVFIWAFGDAKGASSTPSVGDSGFGTFGAAKGSPEYLKLAAYGRGLVVACGCLWCASCAGAGPSQSEAHCPGRDGSPCSRQRKSRLLQCESIPTAYWQCMSPKAFTTASKYVVPRIHCPFGVIPKKAKPGHWCLIVNLSSPENASVNDGIDKDMCSTSYITTDSVVDRILQVGRGALLAKVDQQAYRIVPVDRRLLGVQWKVKCWWTRFGRSGSGRPQRSSQP